MESLGKGTIGKVAAGKGSSEVMGLGIGKKQTTVVIKGKWEKVRA